MENKICQSCGMPLKQDPKHGGTEADGARSGRYCSYCYTEGKFTGSFQNAKDMQKFCINQLVSKKVPRLFAWALTRRIPQLERWR